MCFLFDHDFTGGKSFGLKEVDASAVQVCGPALPVYACDKASRNVEDVGPAAAGRVDVHLTVVYGYVELFHRWC